MYGYKSAVICAAITDMAICETNPDETKTVNVTGTIELIKNFLQKKIHIVFLSTNQVFDGEEPMRKPDAPRNLINEYGKQKAEVETFIEELSNACTLRLTKVIHPGLVLLETWQNSLTNGQPVHAFSDMSLSTISIDEVVQKIDFLVKEKATGVFQLSGEKDISYFEFSQEFAIENGYSPVLVKKDSWRGKLELAPPKFTSMVNV